MNDKSIVNRVKDAVRSITPYTLGEYDYEVKINQNENPYDVSQDIKKEILDFALERSWSRYPSFVPSELRQRLSEYAQWNSDGVLVGNGSNELIQAVLTVMLEPGGKLVIPTPTFTLYRLIGSVIGANVVTVPLLNDYTFDCDSVEREFFNGGDVVVVCSPNNPTGCIYPYERLLKLLEGSDALVIVDEAYFEFSGESVVKLLDKYDNLVVLRTFSKAFSMAGLRVGYALMVPELAREVEKAVLPYNINFFSTAAALKLLENKDSLQCMIDELIESREILYAEMQAIDGITAFPSRANFILFETPFKPKEIFNALLEDKLLVRDVSSYPMLDKALRVSVSTPEDNKRFILSLKRVMNTMSKAR